MWLPILLPRIVLHQVRLVVGVSVWPQGSSDKQFVRGSS